MLLLEACCDGLAKVCGMRAEGLFTENGAGRGGSDGDDIADTPPRFDDFFPFE
jgi:hypothetical protein